MSNPMHFGFITELNQNGSQRLALLSHVGCCCFVWVDVLVLQIANPMGCKTDGKMPQVLNKTSSLEETRAMIIWAKAVTNSITFCLEHTRFKYLGDKEISEQNSYLPTHEINRIRVRRGRYSLYLVIHQRRSCVQTNLSKFRQQKSFNETKEVLLLGKLGAKSSAFKALTKTSWLDRYLKEKEIISCLTMPMHLSGVFLSK